MIERRDIKCRLTGDVYVEAFVVVEKGRVVSSIIQVPYIDMQAPGQPAYGKADQKARSDVQRWLDANQRR